MATPTFISGFETRDFQEWDASGGSPAIVTTGSRSGNCHAKFTSSGDYIEHTNESPTIGDRYWCFYIKYSGTAPSSDTMFFRTRTSTPTDIMGLTISTNGKLKETVIGTTEGTNVLSTGWENRIEITYSGDSDDKYRIYLNGTLEITTDAESLAINNINLMTDQTYDIEIDDVWIEKTTTLLGDHKIVGLFPNANGSDAWDTGGYADVDDWITVVEDDTTTEALSTGSPSSATDHVQNTSVYSIGASDTINAVVAAGMVRRGTGGGAEHKLRITSHTPTNDDSADLGIGTGYVFKSFVSTLTMPTPAQLDSWEIGGVTTGARDFKATATGLMIDYTPAGVTDYPLELGPGTYALTGLAATVLHGGFMNGVAGAYALTGLAATFARGYPLDAASGSYAIAGSDMTPLAGYLTQADSGAYNLSGIDAELLAGYLASADPGAYSLNGLAANFAVGFSFNAETGTYSLNGVDVTTLVGRIFQANAGSYGITGIDGTLAAGRLFQADAGAYSLNGIDAAFLVGFSFNAETGTYSLTGVDITPLVTRVFPADAGAYNITGIDAETLAGYLAVADPGAYSISGIAASFFVGFAFNAETGAYTITGPDATLLADRLASLDPGVYTLTGLATTLERSYILVTDAGSYLITGAAATPIRGFVVIADTGAYTITGLDTTIPADRLASLDPGSYLITGADAGTVYVSIAGVGIYKPIIRSRRR